MNREEKRRQVKLAKRFGRRTTSTKPDARFSDQDGYLSNLLNLGVEKHNSGDLVEAENFYDQVLLMDPSHPIALHLLGVIKQQLGKNATARKLISKALSIKPDYAEAHNNLGLVLVSLDRIKEAVDCYERALAINYEFAEAHNNLGLAFQKLRYLNDALASYHQAIALNPTYTNAYYNLGNTHRELGGENIEDAIKNYHKAISINQNVVEIHNHLGMALRDQGKLDKAEARFRTALTINPNSAEVHSNLGSVLKELGKCNEAVACQQKAIEIIPEFAEAHYNLHALFLDPNETDLSIDCLQKAVNIDTEEKTYRFMLGMLLEYCGKLREAKAHLEIVEKGDNGDRAKLDAWRYIKANNERLPPIFGSSPQGFRVGLNAAKLEGLVLEFGVRFGTSIRQIADLANQDVHGFDSFEGLPEAWHEEPKGTYSTKGTQPTVQENVILHTGLFEETLPDFIQTYPSPIRFMNIDCDLYSSTKTVLDFLSPQIVPGTIIVFDEYIGNEQWREDEFKAFQEAVTDYGWNYEYLCFSFMTKQAVVKIT